jgi:hypothetical protein
LARHSTYVELFPALRAYPEKVSGTVILEFQTPFPDLSGKVVWNCDFRVPDTFSG